MGHAVSQCKSLIFISPGCSSQIFKIFSASGDMWWLCSCSSCGLLMPRHPRNVEAHDPGRPSSGLRWDLGKNLCILSMHLSDYSFQYFPILFATIVSYHDGTIFHMFFVKMSLELEHHLLLLRAVVVEMGSSINPFSVTCHRHVHSYNFPYTLCREMLNPTALADWYWQILIPSAPCSSLAAQEAALI